MYGFLLSRRWLGLLGGVVLFAIACAGLGDWQLHRLADRHERNDRIRSNLHVAPVAAGRLLAVGEDPAGALEWRPVRAQGRWDVAHQLLVRLRPLEGQVGFYVLTPLVTSDGTGLVVNRGWVPDTDVGDKTPHIPAPPAGRVTVVGRLRPSEGPASGASPPPGQVTRIDVPLLSRRLPYPVFGGFLELIRQHPAPARAPRMIPPPEPSEGPHLFYAVQWFLFGVLGFVGYVLLVRREAADRRSGEPVTVETLAAR